MSPTVTDVVKRAASSEVIDAAGFVQLVFALHGEYADGKARSLSLEKTLQVRPAEDWINEVAGLFNWEKLAASSGSATETAGSGEPPELHGRLLVIGLGLVDAELREQLETEEAFGPLCTELREPLAEILTERGRKLFGSWGGDLRETVPSWPDDPLLEPDKDLLGRRPFARFLARRIDDVSPESGAHSIHIYGPWGAGKTSLLNILKSELERGGEESRHEWLVVEFNAWRHQHIQPPWWSLMDAIFKNTRRKLKLRQQVEEFWWRLTAGRFKHVLILIVAAWLAAGVFWLISAGNSDPGLLGLLADRADNVATILALGSTLWGLALAGTRSLLLGSARAAQSYTDMANDPTNEIKRRFTGLTRKLLPKRVAILVDDLDRCQSRYVVDLLEGIQTLFREAPVVFVVAADRSWLNACYEEVYEKFRPQIREPGKPLGTLFLEKAFRFSTPMPGMTGELKEAYWHHLLRLDSDEQNMGKEAAHAKAREEVEKAGTESGVRNLVVKSQGRPFVERRAVREEAVVRLAAPEVVKRLEHTLKPYARLLEPNPRAMKLLVNSYSANRALAILAEVEIDLHQLALWTILTSRWPQLADYLAERPGMLAEIGQPAGGAGFPDDLIPLCTDAGVKEVVGGESLHAPPVPLTEDTLMKCSQMRC